MRYYDKCVIKMIAESEKPKYIIWLPMPHEKIRGNARAHWRLTAKLRKSLKLESYIEFRRFMIKNPKLKNFEKATIKRVFYFKTNHRRDIDNFEFGTKAITDGMPKAGLLLDDDKITWIPTEFIINKTIKPHLEYHIYSLS